MVDAFQEEATPVFLWETKVGQVVSLAALRAEAPAEDEGEEGGSDCIFLQIFLCFFLLLDGGGEQRLRSRSGLSNLTVGRPLAALNS